MSSSTIRLRFYPPHVVQFRMHSSVFLYRSYAHLLVRRGEHHNHYLTLYNGTVEVVRLGHNSDVVKALRPYAYPLKRAAQVFKQSYLPKTDEALEAIEAILRSDDLDQVNFLKINGSEYEKRKLDKPSKEERLLKKANSITLEQLCHELKLNPSHVRACFRRNDVVKPGPRWAWPKKQKEKIAQLIQSLLT